jgi:hypothetical protein
MPRVDVTAAAKLSYLRERYVVALDDGLRVGVAYPGVKIAAICPVAPAAEWEILRHHGAPRADRGRTTLPNTLIKEPRRNTQLRHAPAVTMNLSFGEKGGKSKKGPWQQLAAKHPDQAEENAERREGGGDEPAHSCMARKATMKSRAT